MTSDAAARSRRRWMVAAVVSTVAVVGIVVGVIVASSGSRNCCPVDTKALASAAAKGDSPQAQAVTGWLGSGGQAEIDLIAGDLRAVGANQGQAACSKLTADASMVNPRSGVYIHPAAGQLYDDWTTAVTDASTAGGACDSSSAVSGDPADVAQQALNVVRADIAAAT